MGRGICARNTLDVACHIVVYASRWCKVLMEEEADVEMASGDPSL